MQLKKFFSKALACIIGIVVISAIINLARITFIISYIAVFKPETIPRLTLLNGALNIAALIAGIIIGLFSYSKKNWAYQVFSPDRKKIITSLIVSALFITWIFLKFGKDALVNVNTMAPIPALLGIIGGTVVYAISFYPFCSLCYSFKIRKEKKLKVAKSTLVLLLIILNPIFIILSIGLNGAYLFSSTHEPCGLIIEGFHEQSPAREAGMQLGEVIVKVGDMPISSTSDISKAIDSLNSEDAVEVWTREKSYSIRPIFNPEQEKYMIGVNLRQDMCKIS